MQGLGSERAGSGDGVEPKKTGNFKALGNVIAW